MKKRYQMDQQRAVQQFRRLATEQNPNIQVILPMADIVGLLQEGVGNLLRHAGLEPMRLVMDEEVKSLAGERHQQHEQRRAYRWGKENGYCVVDGQKVPIQGTRLRSGDNREQRLGSYELFRIFWAKYRWPPGAFTPQPSNSTRTQAIEIWRNGIWHSAARQP
jgi:putative transposase